MATPVTARPTTPPGAPTATTAMTAALVASGVLALTNAVAFLVLAGRPNPGMAAVSVFPLVAAALLWRRARIAPVTAAPVALLVVFFRPADLAFDLIRPADVLPFANSAALVAAAGVAVVSAVVARSRRGHAGTGQRLVAWGGGTALGAALAAGLVVAWPQADDTGSLSPEQLAALPVVDLTNYEFSPAQLRIGGGQPVAFRFTNDTDDNHTFTIAELGVDVEVPSGRTRVAVVDARPGRYAVHCAAGDHEEKGMVGRLTVTGDERGAADRAPAAPQDGGAHHHG
ncbi:cupredoxin domain-containing protein [Actinosynnema sp. NPDC059797]